MTRSARTVKVDTYARCAVRLLRSRKARQETPSYHDLHITTAMFPRTRLFDLPYGVEVSCTRVSGWQVWQHTNARGTAAHKLLAGEYDLPEQWLVLDVAGHVIADSRQERQECDGDQ